MNKLFRPRRATAEHLESRNLLAGGGLVIPTPSLTLDQANPLETLTVDLDDPSGHEQAAVVLRVRDADFPDEGRLDVNGRGQISLFGNSAGPHLDEQLAELAFTTPANWWRSGENQLTFTHSRGKYFEVQAVQVAFLDSPGPLEIVQPISTPDALHVYHPNDPDAPKGSARDIKDAIKRLTPGDTLIVHEGTYVESFGNADIPGGESWSKPITIKAEGKVVLRPKPGSDRVFTLSHSNTHHVIIDGFVMDAINVKYDAVKITSGTGFSHNIWIRNSEITNAPLSGVLVNGPTTNNRFTNVHVHHNGRSGFHHGLYIAASDTIIENSMIDHNSGWGVHVYLHSGKISRNEVNNNVVHSNGTSGRGFGIGLYRGPSHRAVGNTVFANAQGGIAYGYGTTGGYIADNTVYAHPGDREIAATSTEEGTPTTVTGNTVLAERALEQIPQPAAVLFDGPTLAVADIVAQLNQAESTTGASLEPSEDQPDVTTSVPSTPSSEALPINVSKFTPRHAVSLDVTHLAAYETAIVTFQVVDADFADEGTLDINGKGQLSLFGPNASPELYHGRTARVVFSTPADWWQDGKNTLTFQHETTDGHEILNISVEFLTGPSPVDYTTPIISVSGRSRRT